MSDSKPTDDEGPGGPLPVMPFLAIPADGDPYLEGQRCKACEEILLQQHVACPKCGGREGFEAVQLSNHGELYVYSIVHRSFPGIEVPYVSAIVDLEGGGTVKGNLVGVEPDPEHVRLGMPVEVHFEEAPTKDKEGNSYLTYYFRPRGEA